MRIAIMGLGVVGLCDALTLGRHHAVTITGPVPDRVAAVNAGRPPLDDPELADYLRRFPLCLRATLDTAEALAGAEMIFVCCPLPVDPKTGAACLVEIESRIEFAHRHRPGVPVVVRSGVPIGFCDAMRRRLPGIRLVPAPEFLREAGALRGALHPDLVVVGARGALGARIGALLREATLRPEAPLRLLHAAEAEAMKHFAQAYVAARLAYFNELDSYALAHGLDARQVIEGVCLDPRIGSHASNPCFGVGGHRLPRSTRHMSELFSGAPARLLPVLTHAAEARLSLLAEKVLEGGPRRIGIYRPDNRAGESAPIAALKARLVAAGVRVILFQPAPGAAVPDAEIEPDFVRFKQGCDLILADRMTDEIRDIEHKLFCRDLGTTGTRAAGGA